MEILGAFAPRRRFQRNATAVDVVCLREVRAELLTIGGAIVFVICLSLTIFAFSVSQLSSITQLQQIILIAVTLLSWIYFIDSVTERLTLADDAIEFRALLSRSRLIPLDELEAMLLIYQGFNLEKGIESIEFRRANQKPETLSLGPCWRRRKLEGFLHAVEEALHDPQLLEEVR